jgi:hypothetical protein
MDGGLRKNMSVGSPFGQRLDAVDANYGSAQPDPSRIALPRIAWRREFQGFAWITTVRLVRCLAKPKEQIWRTLICWFDQFLIGQLVTFIESGAYGW